MANPVWPASLPQLPRLEGYQEQAPNNIVRTPMETGPAKMRRRSTAAPRPFTFEPNLTAAQVETLDQFYIATLQDGALAFDWKHPRTQATASLRFTGPPQYRAEDPDNWTAVCALEVLP